MAIQIISLIQCMYVCVWRREEEREYERRTHTCRYMGWLRLVGSLKLQVCFAKEPYKKVYILPKRPIILRSLLIVATLYIEFGKLLGSAHGGVKRIAVYRVRARGEYRLFYRALLQNRPVICCRRWARARDKEREGTREGEREEMRGWKRAGTNGRDGHICNTHIACVYM